jgi:hypothetical protein
MAVAVMWLVFGYAAPSSGPSSSPKGTSHSLSNMNFGELVTTFLCGVALVAGCIVIGVVVAGFWPRREGGREDE